MKNNINKHFSCKNLIRWVKPKWESLVGTDICPEAIGVTKIKRKTVKPCRKYSHRAISVNVESKTYRRQVFLQESIKERKRKNKSDNNSKINDKKCKKSEFCRKTLGPNKYCGCSVCQYQNELIYIYRNLKPVQKSGTFTSQISTVFSEDYRYYLANDSDVYRKNEKILISNSDSFDQDSDYYRKSSRENYCQETTNENKSSTKDDENDNSSDSSKKSSLFQLMYEQNRSERNDDAGGSTTEVSLSMAEIDDEEQELNGFQSLEIGEDPHDLGINAGDFSSASGSSTVPSECSSESSCNVDHMKHEEIGERAGVQEADGNLNFYGNINKSHSSGLQMRLTKSTSKFDNLRTTLRTDHYDDIKKDINYHENGVFTKNNSNTIGHQQQNQQTQNRQFLYKLAPTFNNGNLQNYYLTNESYEDIRYRVVIVSDSNNNNNNTTDFNDDIRKDNNNNNYNDGGEEDDDETESEEETSSGSVGSISDGVFGLNLHDADDIDEAEIEEAEYEAEELTDEQEFDIIGEEIDHEMNNMNAIDMEETAGGERGGGAPYANEGLPFAGGAGGDGFSEFSEKNEFDKDINNKTIEEQLENFGGFFDHIGIMNLDLQVLENIEMKNLELLETMAISELQQFRQEMALISRNNGNASDQSFDGFDCRNYNECSSNQSYENDFDHQYRLLDGCSEGNEDEDEGDDEEQSDDENSGDDDDHEEIGGTSGFSAVSE